MLFESLPIEIKEKIFSAYSSEDLFKYLISTKKGSVASSGEIVSDRTPASLTFKKNYEVVLSVLFSRVDAQSCAYQEKLMMGWMRHLNEQNARLSFIKTEAQKQAWITRFENLQFVENTSFKQKILSALLKHRLLNPEHFNHEMPHLFMHLFELFIAYPKLASTQYHALYELLGIIQYTVDKEILKKKLKLCETEMLAFKDDRKAIRLDLLSALLPSLSQAAIDIIHPEMIRGIYNLRKDLTGLLACIARIADYADRLTDLQLNNTFDTLLDSLKHNDSILIQPCLNSLKVFVPKVNDQSIAEAFRQWSEGLHSSNRVIRLGSVKALALVGNRLNEDQISHIFNEVLDLIAREDQSDIEWEALNTLAVYLSLATPDSIKDLFTIQQEILSAEAEDEESISNQEASAVLMPWIAHLIPQEMVSPLHETLLNRLEKDTDPELLEAHLKTLSRLVPSSSPQERSATFNAVLKTLTNDPMPFLRRTCINAFREITPTLSKHEQTLAFATLVNGLKDDRLDGIAVKCAEILKDLGSMASPEIQNTIISGLLEAIDSKNIAVYQNALDSLRALTPKLSHENKNKVFEKALNLFNETEDDYLRFISAVILSDFITRLDNPLRVKVSEELLKGIKWADIKEYGQYAAHIIFSMSHLPREERQKIQLRCMSSEHPLEVVLNICMQSAPNCYQAPETKMKHAI
jgi:hypothetical protein